MDADALSDDIATPDDRDARETIQRLEQRIRELERQNDAGRREKAQRKKTPRKD